LQAFPHVITADDVAYAICCLASPHAAAISGADLVVDCALLTGMDGELPDPKDLCKQLFSAA
jgi:enoyl-[acyl-carrier-protein] reductase (NADH)